MLLQRCHRFGYLIHYFRDVIFKNTHIMLLYHNFSNDVNTYIFKKEVDKTTNTCRAGTPKGNASSGANTLKDRLNVRLIKARTLTTYNKQSLLV